VVDPPDVAAPDELDELELDELQAASATAAHRALAAVIAARRRPPWRVLRHTARFVELSMVVKPL
jgi:hypothetical protein